MIHVHRTAPLPWRSSLRSATGVARSDEVRLRGAKLVDSWTLGPKPLCHQHRSGPHGNGLLWTPWTPGGEADAQKRWVCQKRQKRMKTAKTAASSLRRDGQAHLLAGRRDVGDGRAPHVALEALVVERQAAMHGAAIVPHDEVVDAPAMAVDEL